MYIKVSVRTNSKREFVKEEKAGEYLIAVKAPPERGLANKRTLELLRSYFGINKRVIGIASGHHSPHKIVNIEDKV